MKAKIFVTLKSAVLDPQGKAVTQALHALGFNEVRDVRVGKFLEVQLNGVRREEAEAHVREMCERLLANPVIEQYRIEIEG
ncbi:MAG: phosphoribosylformylglycinamidine synthase subunit PurS [Nitrospirae bacterium]|nr:phosphoribosylformylglycinamidine synthase subunit PurS [Nitrospirota bacterium]